MIDKLQVLVKLADEGTTVQMYVSTVKMYVIKITVYGNDYLEVKSTLQESFDAIVKIIGYKVKDARANKVTQVKKLEEEINEFNGSISVLN